MSDGFFKRNWLGITGLYVGIVGITLSIIFYSLGRRTREPVFVEDPERTLIVSAERVAEAPLTIVRADEQRITQDVVSMHLYFWNAGRASIRSEHVLEPITLTLEDERAEILESRLVRTTRKVSGISLARDPKNPARGLHVSFTILEQDDGGVVQIVFEGPLETALSVSGTIEGVMTFSIRAGSSQPEFSGLSKIFLTAGFLISVTFPVLILAWLEVCRRAAEERGWSSRQTRVAVLIGLAAIAASIGLLYMFAAKASDRIDPVPAALRSEAPPGGNH